MLFSFAYKNILAYKKRSIITLILTTLTTTLMVFSTALMDGSHMTMIRSSVEIYSGYIQLTHKDFRDVPGLDSLIFDTTSLFSTLKEHPDIHTFGARFETTVLYSSQDKAMGGLFAGVQPEQEQHLSRLKSSLHKGRYLSSPGMQEIYMGVELAKRLKVEVGDTLSFIGTGADYSFTADNIRVVGLFQTGLYDFDANSGFVSKDYFDEIMVSGNMATHIIILPITPSENEILAQELSSLLQDKFSVDPWQKTMSGLVQGMKIDSIFGYITLAVIFLVIFFVIMIYTLLNVFSRIHEVGILRAIGTAPSEIFRLLFTEAVYLSLLGVCLGGLAGAALSYYFSVNPIHFSGYEEQFKQYGLAASAMPANFSTLIILRDMGVMFVLSLCSSLYPILKIISLRPIEAINHV